MRMPFIWAAIYHEMNFERYDFLMNENLLDFEFESLGPKGKIIKIVRFSPQNTRGIAYFNLGLGDLVPGTGRIDDRSISDNKDRDKILATIAAIVLTFMQYFPDALVYAKGSTPSRTRLYQMAILANWKEIEPWLEIYGFVDEGWQKISRNVNYVAFLALRKKVKFEL